jgi:hypothetical protein
MAEANNETIVSIYQTVRETISNLDSILVTLLTQGNTFVIAILSIPPVAGLTGIPAAGISLFALILGLFLSLANLLYWNLLKRAAQMAQSLEEEHLKGLGHALHITAQLNKAPLSAARGSFLLYLILPISLVLAATVLGSVYLLSVSATWGIGYLLACLLIVATSVAVYGMYLRSPQPA